MSDGHGHHDAGHETHTAEDFKRELQHHDEWFRHSREEPDHQQPHGETKAWTIMTFLVVVAVLTIGSGGFIVHIFTRVIHDTKVVRQEENPAYALEFRRARGEWEGALTAAPEWVDAERGVVRVPVAMAAEHVIEEYRRAQAR